MESPRKMLSKVPGCLSVIARGERVESEDDYNAGLHAGLCPGTGSKDCRLIRIEKSVYAPKETSDGKRILVMTLWPRGVSRDKVDVWMKELGTPRELIRRYKTGKVSWDAYASEYRRSLRGKEEVLKSLARESRTGTITLLCTEKDPGACHRSLLKAAIEAKA